MKSSTALAERIAGLRPKLFDGLAPEELQAALGAGSVRRYAANSVITNEGDHADRLYLLLEGRARFFMLSPHGQKTILLRIAPGEIYGLAAILARRTLYIVSAEAVLDSFVLVWERDALRRLAAQCPLLLENALLISAEYLVLYRATHVSLISHSARERVANVLVNLASGFGEKVEDGVELDINNEELANEANVTLFTTSRLMSEWQRKGMVVKTRGKVLLRSPEMLLAG